MKSQLVNQNKNFKIRFAKESDISEILKIQSETNLSFWSEADYKNEIESEDSSFKVAVSDGQTIGFALVRLLLGNEANKFENAEILNIAVIKSFQNQQIGQKLFEEILAEIKNLNIKEIWLEVRESNQKAAKFYQKNGFVHQFVRKNYYVSPKENALILKVNYEISS